MKKLLAIILLLSAFVASAVDYRLSYTVTVTNAPAEGDTLVINGVTRTATNGAQASLDFVIGANAGATATNLFNQLAAYPPDGLNLTLEGTNVVKLFVRNINTPISVTSSGTWATLTLNSNTVSNPIPVTVPVSDEPEATNRVRVGSELVNAINDYSTLPISQTSTAASGLVGLANAQTISGDKIHTGSVTSLNSSNVIAGTLTNAVIYVVGGSGTNLHLYALTVHGGVFSGAVEFLTNGYWRTAIISDLTTTNAVNYGNAFSSRGSGVDSEQFGTTASAAGDLAVAFGPYSSASGASSFAGGAYSGASGSDSAAVGANAKALGDYTVAFGPLAIASGNYASAFGYWAKGIHENSTAIGYMSETFADNQVVLGSTTVNHIFTLGRMEALGGYTNAFFTGTNAVHGDLSFSIRENTSLADGANSGVVLGTNVISVLSGNTNAASFAGFKATREGDFKIVGLPAGSTLLRNSGLEPIPTNRIETNSNFQPMVYYNGKWHPVGRNVSTDFNISTNKPTFGTWYTNGASKALLTVAVSAFSNGTDESVIRLDVENGAKTNAFYHASEVTSKGQLTSALNPGGRYRVVNEADPLGASNTILDAQLSEF